jgi:hypothetical protein
VSCFVFNFFVAHYFLLKVQPIFKKNLFIISTQEYETNVKAAQKTGLAQVTTCVISVCSF